LVNKLVAFPHEDIVAMFPEIEREYVEALSPALKAYLNRVG
jgi:hypothetical protein